MKLWEKGTKVNKFSEQFTVGNDYLLDQKLVKYDCIASIAHAAALQKAGILSAEESKKLKKELLEIVSLSEEGKFEILQAQEDCHTAIENHLTKKLGGLGKKIHTARSRNDQVITAIRLYSKQQLLLLEKEIIALCKQILKFAKKNEFIAIPGYTHTRKAMPSSLGLWAGSFIESLMDSVKTLEMAYELNNQCPAGSAAGYGTPLFLDRDLIAKLLGVQQSPEQCFVCPKQQRQDRISYNSWAFTNNA